MTNQLLPMPRRENRRPPSSGNNSRPQQDPRDAPPTSHPFSTRHRSQGPPSPQPPPQTRWLPLWEQGISVSNPPCEIPSDHAWHHKVETVARYALKILGSTTSREALADIGKDAVTQWDRTQHVYFDKLDRMSEWVDTFLDQLDKNFVRVELAKRMHLNGAFKPNSWNDRGVRGVEWEPWLAGEVHLNYFVSSPSLPVIPCLIHMVTNEWRPALLARWLSQWLWLPRAPIPRPRKLMIDFHSFWRLRLRTSWYTVSWCSCLEQSEQIPQPTLWVLYIREAVVTGASRDTCGSILCLGA